MIEKIIDFRVQLLVILHDFSDSITMIVMMKKNDLEDLIIEVV